MSVNIIKETVIISVSTVIVLKNCDSQDIA